MGMDRKDIMTTTTCPLCGGSGVKSDRFKMYHPGAVATCSRCGGAGELPPITCGQELADGRRCERPSLHYGSSKH